MNDHHSPNTSLPNDPTMDAETLAHQRPNVPTADPGASNDNPDAPGLTQLDRPVATGSNPPEDQSVISPASKPDDRSYPDASIPPSSDVPVATAPRPDASTATAIEDTQGSEESELRSVPPDGAVTVTILEATHILREEKGFDEVKPRAIQRYCSGERRAGQLTCYWNYQSDQYLVDRASLDAFAERLSNEAPRDSDEPGEMEHATDHVPDAPKTVPESVQETRTDDLRVYDHPYVKKLEERIERQEERYSKLQAEHREDMNLAQQRLIQLQQATVIGNSETLADFMLKSGQGFGLHPLGWTVEVKVDTPVASPDYVTQACGRSVG